MKIRNYLVILLTSIAVHAMEEDKEEIGRKLNTAILNNNQDEVEILLTQVNDINAYGEGTGLDIPALSIASRHGKPQIVQLLLDNKADTAVTDDSKDTPLHDAVNWNHCTVVRLLIKSKAPVNACNAWKQTPLHYAFDQEKPSYRIINILLKANADPNCQDDQGDTAAHLAYTKNRIDIIQLLQTHNANFELENENGEKPIDLKPIKKERPKPTPLIGVTTTNKTFDEALGYFFQNREAEKVPGYDPELEKILDELKETADELDKTLNI